jgi:hypothetical protein
MGRVRQQPGFGRWRAVRVGAMLAAAAAVVAVALPASPAAADSVPIWTGPTVSATLVQQSDGNWAVSMIGTGFPANYNLITAVEDLSQPTLPTDFWYDPQTTAAPYYYCGGSDGCTWYPAGSIVPPSTIYLQRWFGKANCGDSLIAYAGNGNVVHSNVVSLTMPACPAAGSGGGGIGSGNGGVKPGPHPM